MDDYISHSMVTRDHIINEIKRTTADNQGKPAGIQRFAKLTGISRSDWHGKYWARWGDALVEAGYSPNRLTQAYDDEFVILKMIEIIRELEKYPVAAELKMKARQDPAFPSHSVFDRFGGKRKFASIVLEYCRNHEGYEDVATICESITTQLPQEITPETPPGKFGFVYLMKSGKFYKIGRTKHLGLREYQIGLQLPERLITVHAIKTDDPEGIEKYWHNRFADKRVNGEWFDLRREELLFFKRRKFM